MRTIHFNTGRKYTVHGQRITATLKDDGTITFFDHSRGISGEITGRNFDQYSIMKAYDLNELKDTEQSWNDAMRVDGVNAKWEDEA